MKYWNFEAAVVPVTGAASGIGLAICKRLREEGARPLLLDVNPGQLALALQEIYPGEDRARNGYEVDVCDATSVENTFARIREEHGPVAHAVANAGIIGRGHVMTMPDELWHRVIDVNLNGSLYTCRAAARQMIERQGGSLVTMSSTAGLSAKAERVAYVSSKAAVVNMTRALALDLGGNGIRVNGVAPGITDTPIQQGNQRSAVEALAGRSALGRLAAPEEIANVVLFLLSDLASYVSGHTVVVDGGLTARYA